MKYIAYGSNMNIEQMKYRCPHSKVIGTGKLQGWKLVFRYHADITFTGKSDDTVPVVIWDIADEDIVNLDIYEGYPKYYTKITVDFINDCGKKEKAEVYIMENRNIRFEVPQSSYFRIIVDGCRQNGIDVSYLRDALLESCEKCSEVYT